MTVDRQLHDSAVDLLPPEMAEDSLVRWVTDYDGMTRQFDRETDPFKSFQNDWREDREQPLMFCYLGSLVLQTRLPFYFAALFHIGRVWQVSQTVLATIPSTKQGRALRTWAASLAERLSGKDKENRAVAILQRLSEASKQYHSRQFA